MKKPVRIHGRGKPHLYIKEWMDHLGVSDEQMASRIGVGSRTTVWKRYTDQGRLDLGKIQELADALGISPHQLNFPPGTPSLDAIAEAATTNERAMAADVLSRLFAKAR